MVNPILLDGLFSFGGKLIDRFFPDATLAAAAKLELITLQQNGELAVMANETNLALAQIAVNAEEAKSSSIFVSGARPSIMWICAFALAYASILEPIGRFVGTVVFGYTGAYPVIDNDITMQVLYGILGLGAYRSYERVKGVIPNGK